MGGDRPTLIAESHGDNILCNSYGILGLCALSCKAFSYSTTQN